MKLDQLTYAHYYERFCLLLIEARKSAHLTQVQLASKLGKPQSFVSKYESSERRLDVIEFLAIASALDLDQEDFFRTLRDGSFENR